MFNKSEKYENMIKEISEFDLAVMLSSDNYFLRIFSPHDIIILQKHFRSCIAMLIENIYLPLRGGLKM